MQLGMVGLGRMGANMTRRLMRGGHKLVVSDLSADSVKEVAGEGATGSASLEDLIGKLTPPRAVWIMVPAGGPTESTVQKLAAHLQAGDAIIDGGNSYFKDDVRRANELKGKGIHYIDVGTSGTKTLAMREDGEILASATVEYPLSSPHPGWSEQDPDDWWQATI